MDFHNLEDGRSDGQVPAHLDVNKHLSSPCGLDRSASLATSKRRRKVSLHLRVVRQMEGGRGSSIEDASAVCRRNAQSGDVLAWNGEQPQSILISTR